MSHIKGLRPTPWFYHFFFFCFTAKILSPAEKWCNYATTLKGTLGVSDIQVRRLLQQNETRHKMPGRQAHGRSLTAAPKAKAGGKKSSKARSQKNVLNAFGIAQNICPTKFKKTPRARELDAELDKKHGRDDEDEDDEDADAEQPRKKKARGPSRNVDDIEDGSDSDGNEWRLGGLREDDEDSEIESDDAFGDSDNEKFEEYSFRGSKSKPVSR